jgi:hypothetical protein
MKRTKITPVVVNPPRISLIPVTSLHFELRYYMCRLFLVFGQLKKYANNPTKKAHSYNGEWVLAL